MGGEIKVEKKNGPGALMRLYLILSTPADLNGAGKHCQFKFKEHKLTVSKLFEVLSPLHCRVSILFSNNSQQLHFLVICCG